MKKKRVFVFGGCLSHKNSKSRGLKYEKTRACYFVFLVISQQLARTKNTPLDHRLQLFVRLVEIIVDDDGIKESTP